MKYYRVKPETDSYSHSYVYANKLVVKELYTDKQMNKLNLNPMVKSVFEPIVTSSRNTYYFFGARFAADNNKIKSIN